MTTQPLTCAPVQLLETHCSGSTAWKQRPEVQHDQMVMARTEAAELWRGCCFLLWRQAGAFKGVRCKVVHTQTLEVEDGCIPHGVWVVTLQFAMAGSRLPPIRNMAQLAAATMVLKGTHHLSWTSSSLGCGAASS